MTRLPEATLESRLAAILSGYAARQDTNAVRFALASPSRDWDFEWAAPGSPEQYFIASATKLYVSALIMQLRQEGRLEIDAAVIEACTSRSYEAALQERILNPLGLADTYPFTLETINRYDQVAAILYGENRLAIPNAMASVRADGGIVSTARDGLAFLQAFTTGALFANEYLEEMQWNWRRIFAPLEYGMGIMRFALPRIFSPFKPIPPMVGHSGASGAVLYWVPQPDLTIAGTVNQVKNRSLSYKLMTRLVMACLNTWEREK